MNPTATDSVRPFASTRLNGDVRDALETADGAVARLRNAVSILRTDRSRDRALLMVRGAADDVVSVVRALDAFLAGKTTLPEGDVQAVRRFGASAGVVAHKLGAAEHAYVDALRASYLAAGYAEVTTPERGWPESAPVGMAKRLVEAADRNAAPVFALVQSRLMIAWPGPATTADARAAAALEVVQRSPHAIGSTLNNAARRAARVVELTEAQRVPPKRVEGKVLAHQLPDFLNFAEIDAAAANLLAHAAHDTDLKDPKAILESKRKTAAGLVDAHAPDDLQGVWLRSLRAHTDAAKQRA